MGLPRWPIHATLFLVIAEAAASTDHCAAGSWPRREDRHRFFPGGKGLIPDPAWKRQFRSSPSHQGWPPGDTLNVAIGRLVGEPHPDGGLLWRPGHQGAVYRPHLVRAITSPTGSDQSSVRNSSCGRAQGEHLGLAPGYAGCDSEGQPGPPFKAWLRPARLAPARWVGSPTHGLGVGVEGRKW